MGRRGWTILIIIIALAIIVASSIVTVGAGQRGVVTRFGAVTGRVLDEGLNIIVPFIDSAHIMTVQTQIYEVGATSASKDLQDVATTIALNYHLNPDRANEVYQTMGDDYIVRLAAPAVQEVVKQVTAEYPAEDLILKRDIVRADIQERLFVRLGDRGIIVEAISITNFQFSAVFNSAIEAKVAAEQAVAEAKNKLERVKVEAQQAEEEARGFANARIVEAEGQAQAIRIVTDAQVLANQQISATLNDKVLQYILYDRLGEQVQLIIVPAGTDMVLPSAY
ncbi:prohibitin family protein [Chloroflexota bacterium]